MMRSIQLMLLICFIFTPESAVDDEPQKEEQVSSQADPESIESSLAESPLKKNENEVAEHQLESSSSDESETLNSSEDVQARIIN